MGIYSRIVFYQLIVAQFIARPSKRPRKYHFSCDVPLCRRDNLAVSGILVKVDTTKELSLKTLENLQENKHSQENILLML